MVANGLTIIVYLNGKMLHDALSLSKSILLCIGIDECSLGLGIS